MDFNKVDIDKLNNILINEYERKIATLEAKIYVYEAIIAKSNFMPVLINQGADQEEA